MATSAKEITKAITWPRRAAHRRRTKDEGAREERERATLWAMGTETGPLEAALPTSALGF